MSNFTVLIKHPITHKYINATWLDDYFGKHHYGVKFENEEKIYDPVKYKKMSIKYS